MEGSRCWLQGAMRLDAGMTHPEESKWAQPAETHRCTHGTPPQFLHKYDNGVCVYCKSSPPRTEPSKPSVTPPDYAKERHARKMQNPEYREAYLAEVAAIQAERNEGRSDDKLPPPESPLPVPPSSPVNAPPGAIGSKVWPGALKVAEECAELIQVCMKLIAFPEGVYPDGTDLLKNLSDERADVTAAITFMGAANGLHNDWGREEQKVDQFHTWHEEGLINDR